MDAAAVAAGVVVVAAVAVDGEVKRVVGGSCVSGREAGLAAHVVEGVGYVEGGGVA